MGARVTFSRPSDIVEAGQQALKDAPRVDVLVPDFIRGPFWNYVPLLFLIAAGSIWILGRFGSSSRGVPETVGQNHKLVIDSAVYGTGPLDDVSVADQLNTATRDALVVLVDNNLVSRDPAPNALKRLEVEYSYCNSAKFRVSRPEHTRLVLPEDFESQRLETKGEDPLQQVEQPLPKRVRDICSEITRYIVEQGQRPDEDKLWNEIGDDSRTFVPRYNKEIQPWDDKLAAGYWLRFRDRLVNLRRELTLRDCQDEQLALAMLELDQHPTRTYMKALRLTVERFRYLASKLED
jgi:hypothetical protein